MAIRILSNGVEVRKPGKTVKTGVSILAGQAVMLDTTDTTGATILLANGNSVCGFALESNVAPLTLNLQYDDYNRGGLISYVAGSGSEIEVWNDGRGDIVDTTVTFAINDPIYATATGKLSNVSLGGAAAIGFVTKVPLSAVDSLRIQLYI